PALQQIDHLHEDRIACTLQEHVVDPVHRPHRSDGCAVAALGGRADVADRAPEGFDIRRLRVADEELGGEPLALDPHLAHRGRELGTRDGYDRASNAQRLDESLSLELTQRLAHRGATRLRHLAELALDEELARLE